jgi:hypothetical protein
MLSKDEIIMPKDIDSYIIKRKFQSRKNEVYLVELRKSNGLVIPSVLKKYINSNENKSKETFLLRVSLENGLSVPKIYFEGADYILLEYIDGDTFLDTLVDLENNQGENIGNEKNYEVFFELFTWLQKFHSLTKETIGKGYIFEDINFRNFIVSDKIYGIDLEDCHYGAYKERDGGRFCAFLLTYSPSFTSWKVKVARQTIEILTKEFGYNSELLKKEINKEFIEIQKRRKIKIPDGIIKRLL